MHWLFKGVLYFIEFSWSLINGAQHHLLHHLLRPLYVVYYNKVFPWNDCSLLPFCCICLFVCFSWFLMNFILFNPTYCTCRIHVVFGHVVSGSQFVTEVENQKVDAGHRPYADIRITHSGELVLLKKSELVWDNIKHSFSTYKHKWTLSWYTVWILMFIATCKGSGLNKLIYSTTSLIYPHVSQNTGNFVILTGKSKKM